jgi:PAS domain S-box-containing protein
MGLYMPGTAKREFPRSAGIGRYGVVTAILWTLLIAYSLYWENQQSYEQAQALAKMQSQAFFEKDMLYRRWAARHGGVYVPVTESTPPNPYLSHIPERDISTPSGKQLTLMNPAYMTRQVFEMAQEFTGTGRGHITSLNPIRSANAPDPWEKEALHAFEQGKKEIGQLDMIAGKPFYRYMKVLVVEKPCLKCHEAQGYREGQIRGGLSVSVPLEGIYTMMAKELRGVQANHAVIWLLGLGIIGFGTRRIKRITGILRNKAEELEHEIEERQMAQEALQEQTVILEEEIAERRHIEEVVRVSEEKFSKSFDNAPIMMSISTEAGGTYLDVNKKFLEISGFNREEVVGKTSVELGWMTEEQRNSLLSELSRNGSIAGIPVTPRSKKGEAVSCVLSGEYITVDGSRCVLLLAHDVTDQKAMEEQLRQSQKMEAIGQLAGGVAHDFNNILTVIMGYSNLLQMDPKLSDHQREEVEQIVSSSEKAAQLTRGLLAFSRKEAVNLKRVNLNDTVQHVQKFLVRVIGEDIQLKTGLCRSHLPVNADSAQIEQVLINLATNARDAMQKGGVLSVETELQEIDESFIQIHGYGSPGFYARITISDNGSGMDEETCGKIFEPFFTTKESGKGTGLGMAIVYGIVKQHKGFINVYSEPGQGTTFRIYLPLLAHGEAGFDSSECTISPVAGGTETILVVEDNVSVSTLIQTILESYGYRVILAHDGQEGVEQFTLHRDGIELVLMDVIMPRKNGQEALQEIRSIQPDVKAIYLSGYTADFIQSRGVDHENVELVMKPIQPIELLRTVRELLDKGNGGPV